MEVNEHVVVCYDLECIEHLFDAPKLLQRIRNKFGRYPSIYGDSVDEGEVDNSPEMPRAAAKVTEPDPEFAFNYPSNSTQAVGIRQNKSNEIGEILSDVSRRSARLLSTEQHQGGDLVLKRPVDLFSGTTQYKKQGLTRYDKIKERKLSLAPVSHPAKNVNENRGTTDHSPSSMATQSMPICYCRESHANGEIVKCSGDTCQIGSFHLHCCQIEKPPAPDERFYCCYCAANLGVIDREAIVYGISTEMEDKGSDNDVEMDDQTPIPVTGEYQRAVNESGPLTGSTLVDDHLSPRSIASMQTDGPSSHSKSIQQDALTRVMLTSGDHSITFTDLAPFIEADLDPDSPHHVSARDGRRLAQWKSSCPPSKMIRSASTQRKDELGLCGSAMSTHDYFRMEFSNPKADKHARLSCLLAES